MAMKVGGFRGITPDQLGALFRTEKKETYLLGGHVLVVGPVDIYIYIYISRRARCRRCSVGKNLRFLISMFCRKEASDHKYSFYIHPHFWLHISCSLLAHYWHL